MGEDEGELDQHDESSRLAQLQRNIDDRKRKRQGDQNGRTHVSRNQATLGSKQLISDVRENETKEAKKEKRKSVEDESEKKWKKQKQSLKEGTTTTEDDDDEIKPVKLSLEPDALESNPEEDKVTGKKKKKSKNAEDKLEKRPKKRSSEKGLTREDSDKYENMDIYVDSDTLRNNPDENKVRRKKEKKMKRVEDKAKKKLGKLHLASKDGITTEDNDDNSMEASDDSEVEKDTGKKEKKRKGENIVSNGKRESEPDKIPQERQDTPEEMPEEERKDTGFTVIGGQKKDKEVKKVRRVLPDWLAKPTIINSDFNSVLLAVEQIPYLDSHILNKLQQHDINHLFPVQSVVIPAILSQMGTKSSFGRGGYEPSDICVSAPTGSGKTLAYVLPIIQSLLHRVVCHLRALIILPTKDLANQVKQVFEMFTEGTNLRVGLASGSKSFSKDQEQLVCHR